MSWFNAGWLLLDLAIIAVLIPTVILQRRESGATLARSGHLRRKRV